MSIYAVGDIHGCFTALVRIFNSLEIGKDDKAIFLGDYIDRGHNSKEVIEWMLEKSTNPNFIFLKGNHELMMLEARTNFARFSIWQWNGGHKVLDNYGIGDETDWVNKIPEAHWKFIESTKKYYTVGNFIFVHAALVPGVPLEQQHDDIVYWKHAEVPEMYSQNKIVVCGHTSRKNGQIANFGHTICVDTWACGGQWLTCLDVTTGNFLQANQKGELKKGKIEIGLD
ncbi:MAG: serine/threonine protein phosphatase [Bacteroidia bacterium]|nr:serine/threonine protein phosphatase [Bacteroidia bacterium]